MDSEDGELFVKQLATFVRTHEKALANALQFRRQPGPRHGPSQSVSSLPTSASSPSLPERPSTSSSTSGSLAAAFSLGSLNFTSHSVKSAKLSLTPHHLFYLLSRFEDLGIPVGPMGVRIENIHDTSSSSNYVSFLSQSQRSNTHGSDVGSIRSVSSIRSVMSGMSSLWNSIGLGSSISAARTERQKAQLQTDLKYLYSAFTKIPCLRLAPDWRARLIRGYEEFPFDSAVPLYVFKNVQALEVCDIDFRQFFGWDRLADQLRSLTLKRACINDPIEILVDIILDDMDKRRRRTSKQQSSPTIGPYGSSTASMGASPRRSSPSLPHADLHKSMSMPCSPDPRTSSLDMRIGSLVSEPPVDERMERSDYRPSLAHTDSDEAASRSQSKSSRPRSHSPRRPSSSRNNASYVRGSHKVHRSGSGSSNSSLSESWHHTRRGSTSNLLTTGAGIVPASKWRFLKHLSLSENALTTIPAFSLSPLSNTLHSLDLSSNLFTQIPDSLSNLSALRALNLSHCMIDSLRSLPHHPLPAITALNLRANRLESIAGVEKLLTLERLDLRDNALNDPTELARLTCIPFIREIWVSGNPFTRTHKDYRTTIFNLFRNTPGFTDDIIIDAAGPSYSERKYLVERVPIPAVVPVIKPPQVPTVPTVDVSKPTTAYDQAQSREQAVLRKERPTIRAVSGEAPSMSNGSSGSRRKKAPRRRMVDLATSDTTAKSATNITNMGPPPTPPAPLAPLAPLETAFSDLSLSPAAPAEIPTTPTKATNHATSEPNGHYRFTHGFDRGAPSLPPVTPMSPIVYEDKPQIPRSNTAPAVQLASAFSAPDTPSQSTDSLKQQTPSPAKPISTKPLPSAPLTPIRTPTKATTERSSVPSPGSMWKDPSQSWDVGGELYKRKIEALRDQVGDGYLSVLSEETWDPVRHPAQYNDNPFSNASATSPLHPNNPVAARPGSVQAIHSGRTLG